MISIVISYFALFLTFLYVSVVAYLLKGWLAIPYFSSINNEFTTQVSILIAARNEEANIKSTIESLLVQDYPKELMEVIIVDDHSTDETAAIISSYVDKGIRLVSLRESEALNSYKKMAITEAIRLSTGELMVTTDADCQMGKQWLSTIVNLYEQRNPFLISSPVIYFKEKNLFERMQTLEFLYLIGLGAATIGNKQASTCNGANLAYRKDVFLTLGGFKGIDTLASGDDELFLHKVAATYPDRIEFCKSRKAMVYTEAKESLSSFISQRKRWASKSTHYKKKSVVALGACIWLFNLFLLLGLINTVFQPDLRNLMYICFGAKLAVEAIFMIFMTGFAKRVSLLVLIPFLSLIHVPYLIYIGIAGNSGKYQWKGRTVR